MSYPLHAETWSQRKVGVQHCISHDAFPDWPKDVKKRFIEDHAMNQLRVELFYPLAVQEKAVIVNPDHLEKFETIWQGYPATWWDHVKRDLFPAWLGRLFSAPKIIKIPRHTRIRKQVTEHNYRAEPNIRFEDGAYSASVIRIPR